MRIATFLSLVCLSLWSHAQVMHDLYEMSVVVADQSTAQRQQATQEAMQLMLIKVSGSSDVLQHSDVQNAVVRPERYVRSFRYRRDEGNGDRLWMHVVFAPNLVDDLLRGAEQPIWGRNRSRVLVWLAQEENGLREPISTNHPAKQLPMLEAMTERGLPLLWPILDLEDTFALPLERLWGLFQQDIQHASLRYQPDAVLAGRLYQELDGRWVFRGVFEHQQQWLGVDGEGEDRLIVMRQVADQVARFLSDRYALRSMPGLTEGHRIDVSGIETFEQYQQLLRYLSANNAIGNVHVVHIAQGQVSLALELTSEWARIWLNLARDGRLRAIEEGVYQWL
ncbi:MAG: DUF2066 domain-containing protein [Bacterioplanes sp.]|nr:DUF2066 domain-containing protein [Bacterioplanes sp.]